MTLQLSILFQQQKQLAVLILLQLSLTVAHFPSLLPAEPLSTPFLLQLSVHSPLRPLPCHCPHCFFICVSISAHSTKQTEKGHLREAFYCVSHIAILGWQHMSLRGLPCKLEKRLYSQVSAPTTDSSPCGSLFVCYVYFFEVTTLVILSNVLNDLECYSFPFSEIELYRKPVK